MMIAASIYYSIGLSWLVSGLITGWLRTAGNPLGIALWIVTAAAVWPWLVWKIRRDLKHGDKFTDLT